MSSLTAIRRTFALLVLALGILATPAQAAISQLVVFGDSLSDNGNLFRITGTPPAPYVNGRFSNGPVAVEVMARLLGASLDDRAFGGATTGTDVPASPLFNIPSVLSQVGGYLATTPRVTDPNALFVLWAGPNDLLGGLGRPGFDAIGASRAAVDNLKKAYDLLVAAGAKQFLVPLLPDLGITVRARAGGPDPNVPVQGVANFFNATLLSAFRGLAGVSTFDTFKFSDDAYFNPALFGLTNSRDACVSPTAVCTNPGGYFFWDDIHPTATAHAALGTAFAALYRTVAEPGSIALLATLLLLGFAQALRRR